VGVRRPRRRCPGVGTALTGDVAQGRGERTGKVGQPVDRLGSHRPQQPDALAHRAQLRRLVRRLDPAFSEKALGFKSFTDFVKAHPTVAEVDESTNIVLIRLVPAQR
jgi:hypothetical protein